jgi:hypothetical protein
MQAKNLTNPRIEEVYRSKYIPSDEDLLHEGHQYSLGFTISLCDAAALEHERGKPAMRPRT